MQRLKSEDRKRKQSAGVLVMSDKWASTKATRALIEEDVKAREHFPVQRRRQTVDELENGYLVIGTSAITFLGADNQQIVASHPLTFIEKYGQSLSSPCELTYTVKQVHLLKKDDVMSFTFVAPTVDALQRLVCEVDRFVLAHIRHDPQGRPETYVLDKKRNHEVDSEETVHWLPGERFVCERSIVSTEGQGLFAREQREAVLVIFNPRGIAMLRGNNVADDGRGLLDAFSYRSFLSFGAADEGCFGFKVPGRLVGDEDSEEVFVCLYSESSGHLQNTLVSRHARRWEELKAKDEEPPHWPREYTTKSY